MLEDGTQVAVKVQKPSIRDQMPWDLLCYRVMVYAFDYLFELPMYWTGMAGDCQRVLWRARAVTFS